MVDKRNAFHFLEGLSNCLCQNLPGPQTIRSEIDVRWKKPNSEKSPEDKLACKENLFLYHYALPEIANYINSAMGLGREQVRASLRGEYYGKFPHLLSRNAHRAQGHPFGKNTKKSGSKVMGAWKKPAGGQPINQAFPDLCMSAPLPFNIVFDAKFFEKESLAAAEEALVEGVYEAMFYRGLPAHGSGAGDLGYEFGCLLAYDASQSSYLQQAWDSVTSKRLFWDDAHVFVMIVRGQN